MHRVLSSKAIFLLPGFVILQAWISSSSGMIEVFWYMSTLWKAMVGISAMMILRRALTVAVSITGVQESTMIFFLFGYQF